MRGLQATFKRVFGHDATLAASAPGRVNLIGDHTDYNQGLVLPMAIDFHVIALAAPNDSGSIRVYSRDVGKSSTFDLSAIAPTRDNIWSNYIRGVAQSLKDRRVPLVGADIAVAGNVPRGAGLSSSAALELASGYILAKLAGVAIEPVTLALCGQEAENRFVGVQSGIMDQFISALGQPDSALCIDCRDLTYEVVPLALEARGLSVVVVESGVQRGLVSSEYNTRRCECEDGVRALRARLPDRQIAALRDVRPEDIERHWDQLPETIARRARHVVSENERVARSVSALQRGDVETFGRLMYQSHASLRDDYQVTVPDVDHLIELSRACPGVLGARMTGGGFGGSTVHLVRTEAVGRFEREVVERYKAETGRNAPMYVCRAVGGVAALPLTAEASSPSRGNE